MLTIKSKKFTPLEKTFTGFTLRLFKKGDELSLRKSINNKKIYNNTSRIPYPYTLEEAKKWVKKNLAEDKKEDKEFLNFVIDIDNKVAGSIGFSDIKNKQAEIGYWLAEKHWNQGIMTEAVKLAVDFAFKKLGLIKLKGRVFLHNPASKRVLEKVGFKLKKIIKNDAEKEGKKTDSWLMIKKIKK